RAAAAGDLVRRDRAAVLSGWLEVAASAGEQAEQVEADLVPHESGEWSAAACHPGAGAAPAPWGGLVADQNPPQRVDGAGVVTGLF
ncbi:MAG: hypothetical protein ACRDS9_14665, partial [Pseudonocardiaceae bacterium]